MDNMAIYEKARKAPPEALRPIAAGRLKGKTDINPMWRIKALTEIFGPCGIGWNTTNEHYTVIPVEATKEVICIYELDLVYRREDGSWSDPVHGVGGNMLVAAERNGLYANDEGLKMAKTDALSVAAKALGFAADVYWQTDRTKYGESTQPDAKQTGQGGTAKPSATQTPVNQSAENPPLCADCGCVIIPSSKRTAQELAKASNEKFGRVLCPECGRDEAARRESQSA